MEAAEERSKGTILVVEDEVLLRLDLASQLRTAGFDVVDAETAREALSVLERGGTVDLILTDIRMPGEIDGLALAKTVRSRGRTIKIIILSAFVGPQPEFPVDAAFSKPVRVEALLRKVRELLATESV
jgi:CheY-like chemotaxis protein